jgi:hypothetical protein
MHEKAFICFQCKLFRSLKGSFWISDDFQGQFWMSLNGNCYIFPEGIFGMQFLHESCANNFFSDCLSKGWGQGLHGKPNISKPETPVPCLKNSLLFLTVAWNTSVYDKGWVFQCRVPRYCNLKIAYGLLNYLHQKKRFWW